MITRKQAELIAASVVGSSEGVPGAGWQLVEFDSGWLIQQSPAADFGYIGAASTVVERASGRVMRFPSSIPPARIVEEYDQVVQRGHVQKEAPAE